MTTPLITSTATAADPDVAGLLHAHQDLARLLTALARLSAAQLPTLLPEEWDNVLKCKRSLLDAITQQDPMQLFQRTLDAVQHLRGQGNLSLAQQLANVVEENRSRFHDIASLEQAAREALQAQIHTLGETLAGKQRQWEMLKSYLTPRMAEPRFLDKMR